MSNINLNYVLSCLYTSFIYSLACHEIVNNQPYGKNITYDTIIRDDGRYTDFTNATVECFNVSHFIQ